MSIDDQYYGTTTTSLARPYRHQVPPPGGWQVDDQHEADSMELEEGAIIYNRELGAKMELQRVGSKTLPGLRWVQIPEDEQVKKVLTGKTFCLTGKMWEPRELVEKLITTQGGGTVVRTLGASTILVRGPVAGGMSKKFLTADRNGNDIWDHHYLRRVLSGAATPSIEVPQVKGTPVEPVDRERRKRTVNKILADIESIAFRK